MRIEEYTRALIGDGYLVLGSNRDWNLHNDSTCVPIKMELTCSPAGRPYGNSLEELIRLADSDCFLDDEDTREMYPEFHEHYEEIVLGKCPDWQLGAFRVFYGGIELYYGNRLTGETGYLWIMGASRLRLTFVAPRTRLGFDPTYIVRIDCDKDGHSNTEVEEDLGYLRREIHFELQDANKKTDIFHTDNQNLRITEYAGM